MAQAQQMMGGGFGGMGGGFGGGGFGGGGMGGGGFGDKTTTTTPGRTSVCVPGLLCSSSVAATQRRELTPTGSTPRSVGTRSETDRWPCCKGREDVGR